jgi:DNA-binding sugar fermentation-stimulating protein
MQTAYDPKYITATFIKELKNRFLCEVEIDGEHVVCYVPSSCHLSNFLKLEGKKVLLVPTQTKNTRTQYALFAVPYKKSYIILNTSIANRAIENSIHSRRLSDLGKRKTIIKEHYVDGYKSDLFIKDTETIIEIKSVLSMEIDAKFPTVFSERSLEQLAKLKCLLRKGYTVRYIIVSLNPYLKSVSISRDTTFYKELYECLECGMRISAFACRLKNNKVFVDHEITVQMEDYYG